MADVPFATVDDLKARWPDFPPGAEDHAEVLLEDASQFIVDTVPTAVDASPVTLRRICCSVVRRSIQASTADMSGMSQFQFSDGPFQVSGSPANPHGDFYLSKAEKHALGHGRSQIVSVQISGSEAPARHRPWCSLMFGAVYCSCGVDIAGEPIYEA